MPSIHQPRQLVFTSKALKRDFLVPVSLTVPDDFALRFQVRVLESKNGEPVTKDGEPIVVAEILKAAEIMKSAYVIPFVVTQNDTHLLLSAQLACRSGMVPFPFLWYIPKLEIERSLMEQIAKAK